MDGGTSADVRMWASEYTRAFKPADEEKRRRIHDP